MADLERCDPDDGRMRQRCSDGLWLAAGLCPWACREVALPASATPAGALMAVCADQASDGQTTDGWGAADGDSGLDGEDGGSGDEDAAPPADGTPADGTPADGDVADASALDGGADDGATLDGAAACGDGLCTASETAGDCAWDCASGAQTAVACMLAKCPGPAQVCSKTPACPLALAQVWWCAKGCSGCLAGCLAPLSGDVVTFSVASCSAAACLGTSP
jgi:hypothetical protein